MGYWTTTHYSLMYRFINSLIDNILATDLIGSYFYAEIKGIHFATNLLVKSN